MRPAKTTVIHFGSQIGRSVIGFLATLYFANELGAEPLGFYFVAVALLAWLTIPSKSISTAIKKRVSEGNGREHLSAGLVLTALFGGTAGLMLVVFAPWVNGYIGAPIAHLVAGLLFARVLFGAVTAGLEGQRRVEYSGLLKATDQLFRAIIQVGLVIIGFGVAGLLIGHAAALILAAVMGVGLFVVRPSIPSRRDFRDLIDYAKFSWLGTIRTQTFSWMDILILNLFVVPALVGIYEVAWKLASVFVLVNISIQHTLFPEISSLATEADYDKIREFIDEALLFSGMFTIPGLFGAAVVGPEVLEIYSEEFVQGQYILLVLIGARSIDVYGSVFNNTLNAIDRPDVAFRINFVFTSVNVGLNVLLVYLFGWMGAAVATTISVGVVLWMSHRSVNRLVGSVPIPARGISAQLLAGAVMGIVLYGLKQLVPWRSTIVTLGLVFVGVSVYSVLLLLISTRVRQKALSFMPASLDPG